MRQKNSGKDNALDTKTKILKASLDLFAEHSYHQITIQDIKERVGISTGGLFHHFNTKLEIAQEALSNWMENAYKPFYSRLETKNDPKLQLKELINFSIDLFMKKPKIMRFFLEVYELELQADMKSSKMIYLFNGFHNAIKTLMKLNKVPKPALKAHLLIACLDGLLFQYIFSKDSKVWHRKEILKEEIYQLFTKNI